MSHTSPLNHIGKRMPYTTPKGSFQYMEDNIWLAVKEDALRPKPSTPAAPKTPKWTILARSAAAIAAVVAIVFAVHTQMHQDTPAPSINDVDQAFSQLSQADQDFMLEVYQNDIFLE